MRMGTSAFVQKRHGKKSGLNKNQEIYIEPLHLILKALFQVNIQKMAKLTVIYIFKINLEHLESIYLDSKCFFTTAL